MTHAAPGAARGAHLSSASDASPAADEAASPGDERQPVREATRQAARHVAGRLGALPRLAGRAMRPGGRASDAEREAHRRETALQAAESGERTDWARVGIFSTGVVVGALIGAGTALLLAPATGFETRARLAYRARRTSHRVADRVGDLGDDARRGAKRGAKRVSRAATTARWAAEDAWERRRRDR